MICGLGDGRKTFYTTPRKASKKLDTWDCPGMIWKAALPLAYWKYVSIFVGVTQKMFRPSGWTHWNSFCCFNFKWLLSTSHFYRIHLKIRLKLPVATGGFIAGGNVFVAILSDSGFFVDWSSLSRAPPGVLWLGPVMNCGFAFGVWIPMLGKIWQSVWSIHTVFLLSSYSAGRPGRRTSYDASCLSFSFFHLVFIWKLQGVSLSFNGSSRWGMFRRRSQRSRDRLGKPGHGLPLNPWIFYGFSWISMTFIGFSTQIKSGIPHLYPFMETLFM